MKTFKNMAAQGDVLFRRVDELPEGLHSVEAIDGKFTVAHSETGHNHTMLAENVKMYRSDEPFIFFLKVSVPTPVKHDRSWDTHEALEVGPGVYEVRNQVEYTPSGWQRAQD